MKTQQKLPRFNACDQNSLTSFYAFYTRIQKVHPLKPWISGKKPSSFWPPRCRCRSSAPKRNCLHQTVGSSDLLAFCFSVSIHKCDKWLEKKSNSIWFVDQCGSTLFLYHLYDTDHITFLTFHFLPLSIMYNTKNTRTPEISIDEGLESWSPCRARPISHRFCLSQMFSANLFSFTEELSARTACSQQQWRRIKNKISEASSNSLASTRSGDGVWVSIIHESVSYSTYNTKSWNTLKYWSC